MFPTTSLLFPEIPTLSQLLFLDLQETTIEWSGATPVPLRLDESTGFRFRHVGGHGVELREGVANGCCSSVQTQQVVQHIGT